MREISFRGKRTDNGKWEYGYLAEDDRILTMNGNGDNYYSFVDENTVGQYTGLTDKNGKKIFEGDIVTTADIMHDGEVQIKGVEYFVEFQKGCWVISNKNDLRDWDFLCTQNGLEVIGNIHDNPELLKGGNE